MENPWSSEKIRQVFIDFFVKKYEHVFVPSSSVIPNNDPTLLFTNSGMNQFKQIFLGQLDSSSELAGLRRAANSQACIRAGGKHNDLDDVGKDTYHHTFFEMLGNWSFGDYFQEESIEMVVRLMTEVYGIPKENLYATYFEGDEGEGLKPDESARRIWAKYLAEDHILRGDKRDNFWEMGPTGPCGPCSELHYDRLGGRNAADRVNKDDPMVIEVWNIVFIQYNRREDRVLVPLPRRHVDTGMGFERLVSILQNKTSNYDTDVFEDLFRSIQELTGARPYGGRLGAEDEGRVDMAYRILADHARTLTFAISDGCLPGPVGRGYILRRILRRAVRYARECLGAEPGTFARLVPSVVRKMGGFFPKLVQMQERVMEVMEVEERKFAKSLENGLAKFRVMTSGLAPGSLLRGDDVFSLYTAYGFPEDLTRIMAEERGMRVDVEGFERRMREEREEGRRQRKKKLATDALTLSVEACGELNRRGVAKTDDAAKYSLDEVRGQVVAIWDGVVLAEEWSGEGRVGIVLDRTSFYAESGGQKGDVGCIASLESDARFSVDDVQVYGGYVVHIGSVSGGGCKWRVGQRVECEVDIDERRLLASNHTSTHMVNLALRQVLGATVEQCGSVVSGGKLRFDFTYGRPLRTEQVRELDRRVNEMIDRELSVHTGVLELKRAKQIHGIRAVFGEKYPDPVRVVSIGVSVDEIMLDPGSTRWWDYSVELCGGTHLSNTRQAERFVIVEEGSRGAGVHRLVAVTGEECRLAQERARDLEARLEEIKRVSDQAEFNVRVNQFIYDLENSFISVCQHVVLRQRIEELKSQSRRAIVQLNKAAQMKGNTYVSDVLDSLAGCYAPYWVDQLPDGSRESLNKVAKSICDSSKSRLGFDVAVFLFCRDRSNPSQAKTLFVAHVPEGFVVRHSLIARDWVESVSLLLGGKSGGKDQVAQGVSPCAADLQPALDAAAEYARARLA